MINIRNKEKCCGCSACQQICPKQCISMQMDSEGFYYPIIKTEECIGCNRCEDVCPMKNSIECLKKPEFYASYSKEASIRDNSSSGGIFYCLAREVLNNDGVVAACSLDDELNAKHIIVYACAELHKVQGSKYIQSDINGVFAKCKRALSEDRVVLFVGTPCQVAGLHGFLGKNVSYDKLFTIGIACHGVPSKYLFDKYILELEMKKRKSVKKIIFRDKKNGWNKYEITVLFSDDTIESCVYFKDTYMRLFLSDIALRPSCYKCKYKYNNSCSDLIICDFWGIEKILPEWKDDRGYSAVIINTDRGKVLYERIVEKLVSKKVEKEQIIMDNPSIMYSSVKHPNRGEFFSKLTGTTSINELEYLLHISSIQRIWRKICMIYERVIIKFR